MGNDIDYTVISSTFRHINQARIANFQLHEVNCQLFQNICNASYTFTLTTHVSCKWIVNGSPPCLFILPEVAACWFTMPPSVYPKLPSLSPTNHVGFPLKTSISVVCRDPVQWTLLVWRKEERKSPSVEHPLTFGINWHLPVWRAQRSWPHPLCNASIPVPIHVLRPLRIFSSNIVSCPPIMKSIL